MKEVVDAQTTGREVSTAFVFMKLHRQLLRIKFATNRMYLEELLSLESKKKGSSSLSRSECYQGKNRGIGNRALVLLSCSVTSWPSISPLREGGGEQQHTLKRRIVGSLRAPPCLTSSIKLEYSNSYNKLPLDL